LSPTPLKNIRELYLPVSSLAREKQQLYWLVVSTNPSEKYVSSSVGMMTFPIYGKNNMFQTTKQLYCYSNYLPLLTID